MGRTKTQPKRKAITTIDESASHYAAFAPVVSPEEEVVSIKSAKKRRLKKLSDGPVKNGQESDDDIFETFEGDNLIKNNRVEFACDVGRKEGATSKSRRQLIFDFDGDGNSDNEETHNICDGGVIQANNGDNSLTIQQAGDGATIIISSSAYRKGASTSTYELIKYHLPNTKILTVGNNSRIPDGILGEITLTNDTSRPLQRMGGFLRSGSSGEETDCHLRDVEYLLHYCNQSLSDVNDSVETTSILRAFEDDMLEICLLPTTTLNNNDFNHHVIVSINLRIDSLHGDKSKLNGAPPIPVPRKNNFMQKLCKPHPSYVIIQALGSLFKGSIFDDVAKSCLVSNDNNTQKHAMTKQNQKDSKKSIITAGMVYSVVDNLHAKEYSSSSVSPLLVPGLVPQLRPYQEAAVRWMIQRERTTVPNDEWELCWYVISNSAVDSLASAGPHFAAITRCDVIPLPEWRRGKSSSDERQIFCSPFVGWVASTYEDAKYLMFGIRGQVDHLRGGILAEQMGLGKTVEVIACMLANPSPLAEIATSMDTTHLSPADQAISIYQSKTIVESRATLIVTPPSILTQWQREISRHATNLKVVVYPGIKDLCSRPSSRQENLHLLNPRVLADADVVLVTFQVLDSDLNHSDDNPFTGDVGSKQLRGQKRHIVLPSPLTSIKWHRVCLDEAQRVQLSTTKSAKMARKLITDRRWCVSGTPIGRGRLNDLYGLFLFLSIRPFDEEKWFVNSFLLHQGDAMKRLSHLLRQVMWRSTKQNDSVREQMGIPEQEEKKVLLHFSSVEKYFYSKQYEEALESIQLWSATAKPDKLHLVINRLRAACCHPSVGVSGISGRGSKQHGSNSVLSMDEILCKLIDEAKVRCEEAQRLVVLHTNGLACLSKLKAESSDSSKSKLTLLEKSAATYQQVIDLMDKNALPTKVLDSVILSGSLGFRLGGKRVCSESLTLEWQMRPTEEGDGLREAWSEVTFATAKRISSVKIRPCHTLPSELSKSGCNWTVLEPNEIILQVSSDGDGFVDIGSFHFACDEREDAWKEISALRTSKSKACRLVIKSDRRPSRTQEQVQQSNYFVGVDVQFFEPRVAEDSLQRLHSLHNASMVLSSISALQRDGIAVSVKRTAQERLARMENEIQSIHDRYLAHAKAIHRQRKHQLCTSKRAREKFSHELNTISNGSVRTWYEDTLGWLSTHGSESQQREMCEAVKDELRRYYENLDENSGLFRLTGQILMRDGHFPEFNNADGLYYAIQMRLQQGKEKLKVGKISDADLNQCLQSIIENLSDSPSAGEILENAHCKRCRKDWDQTGPVCRHCLLEEDLVKFERLSNDPEINSVLKAVAKVVNNFQSKSKGPKSKGQQFLLKALHKRAEKDLELRLLIREELKAAKGFWRAHFDLLSDIDELNLCKTTMRLQRDDEDISTLTQNEAALIVDSTRIAADYFDHEAKQALASAEMRRSDDNLRFLLNQRRNELVHDNTDQHDKDFTCTICLASFQGERSVLSCGHSFHTECVEKLICRAGRGTISIRCPMRCALTTKREDILVAIDKRKDDGSHSHHEIKGDWGTKVNRLIGDVMDTIKMGDKGVIMSQWDDMLDIVAQALKENSISLIRPHGGRRFGEDVKQFRSSDCPILLMNVKNGAEGLTLTEANHCFLLEPILNHSIDAQAINRIHRIGQTSKTYIHRYIVAHTIEEKIDALRVEREANSFEDDVIQKQKDHFDQVELEKIFHLNT
jgi:SNF2 family DNA or RNA helicase